MGKIRIKTFGSPEEETKQKEKAKARKETKKAKKTAKAPGLKGGERLVTMAPTEEELASMPTPPVEEKTREIPKEKEKKVKTQPTHKKRSQKYQNATKLVDKSRLYPLEEAVSLVKKTSFSRFDGSVDVHLSTTEKGLSGNVQFPHSTGKKVEVAIVDDKILSEIEAGKINFDVLVATPEFMPKLAKVAKILGPRGLMPNPKAGTITKEPEKLAEKLKEGQTRFKTEAEAPLVHLTVGKTSFPNKNLEENLRALIPAVGLTKIKKLTLSSTMGPGIKVDLTTLRDTP